MYSSAPFQKLDRKRDNAYVNNCIMSDLVDGIKFGSNTKTIRENTKHIQRKSSGKKEDGLNEGGRGHTYHVHCLSSTSCTY